MADETPNPSQPWLPHSLALFLNHRKDFIDVVYFSILFILYYLPFTIIGYYVFCVAYFYFHWFTNTLTQ